MCDLDMSLELLSDYSCAISTFMPTRPLVSCLDVGAFKVGKRGSAFTGDVRAATLSCVYSAPLPLGCDEHHVF